MGLLNAYRSTIGKKAIMAVTGLILVAFVIGHMAGNLQVFIGPARMNAYAAFLQGLGELLWLVRLVLFVALVLHVLMAWQLTQIKRQARPIGYEQRSPQVSTLASRSMRWGGVLLLVFIVFHILHFTTGTVFPAASTPDAMYPAFSHGDVYGNVIAAFRTPWVTAFYVVAMLFLLLHLFHGAWSSVRTLGFVKPSPEPLQRRVATVIAVVVWLGFSVIPVAVLLGVIR
ncbi:MAG: succinate dehydrogenase cytochrome b subunit [Gemmatimonadaceae bacterium]|nr:succinate dehydrogenase cytochrome b subunit [Gemmatimonadaceae bacterium]NUO94117.1 succinate dehydrogenase cytochrome b subunit [Gemmatimonadaceae bacterium]NUP55626.1 succinate dehydrogenase cytochrome b subunit [Gemmatimonadaceae bacterium]NUR35680.1 succinate dehydrogenase cytochrome b subunit [Gemmatimonadaceae bacterium]